MASFLFNFGIFIGGGVCMLIALSVCRAASNSDNNTMFYSQIHSLKKKLNGSWTGIKILKSQLRYCKRMIASQNRQINLQDAHIEALEEIADGLINGQESVEKACNKIVSEMGKEFSEKIEHIKKNNRQEINKILDEMRGSEQYIRDLEAQNKNLYELLENSRAVNDKKNLKEVA